MSELLPPPHSIEAEAAVLGGLMLVANDPERQRTTYASIQPLRPEHFYRDRHRKVFAVQVQLIEASVVADAVTVYEALRRAHGDADNLPLAFVTDLVDHVASVAGIEHYAQIVRDRWMLRRIIAIGQESIGVARVSEEPMPLIAAYMDHLEALSLAAAGAGDVLTHKEVLFEEAMRIQRVQSGEGGDDLIPFGFLDQQRLVYVGFEMMQTRWRGFQRGVVLTLAGVTGTGKSTLAEQWSEIVARTGIAVLMVRLEDANVVSARRSLARNSRLSASALKLGRVNEMEFVDLSRAVELTKDLPIYYLRRMSADVDAIRGHVTRLKAKDPRLGVVVVDYVQLVEVSQRVSSENEMLTRVMQRLQIIARENDVLVIAVSQFNRETLKSKEGRPYIHQLRGSGAIENGSKYIGLMWRPEQHGIATVKLDEFEGGHDVSTAGRTFLLWEKFYDDEKGMACLEWDGAHATFRDRDPSRDNAPITMPAGGPPAHRDEDHRGRDYA